MASAGIAAKDQNARRSGAGHHPSYSILRTAAATVGVARRLPVRESGRGGPCPARTRRRTVSCRRCAEPKCGELSSRAGPSRARSHLAARAMKRRAVSPSRDARRSVIVTQVGGRSCRGTAGKLKSGQRRGEGGGGTRAIRAWRRDEDQGRGGSLDASSAGLEGWRERRWISSSTTTCNGRGRAVAQALGEIAQHARPE